MSSVTELVAGNAERVVGSRRPGFFRVFFLTLFACGIGMLAAAAGILLVSLTGLATTGIWLGTVPYLPTGVGPVLADAVVVLYFTSFAVLLVRRILGAWISPDDPPAWTWIAATLVPAGALAATSPAVAITGGWAIVAIAVRYAAWDREGRARREPVLAPRAARRTVVLVPAILLAALSGYALLHPLTIDQTSPAKIAPGTTPVLVNGAPIRNDSGRPVRILSIEPGRERGYALHLTGIQAYNDGMQSAGEPLSHAVTSFVIKPHDSATGLLLQLSRAGCRPGTSGRIETIRVRYARGGVHVMELPLDPAPTLTC
jgi:hypothetical protein